MNIGFNAGIDLPDPAKLLEGNGSAIRHVRVDDASRLGDPALAEIVRMAARAGHTGRVGRRRRAYTLFHLYSGDARPDAARRRA